MTAGGNSLPEWLEGGDADLSNAPASPDSRPDPWAVLERSTHDDPDETERYLPVRSRLWDKVPAFLLMLVAFAWMGGIAWKIYGSGPSITPELVDLLALIAIASGPVALLAIAYLLVGPTSRREARRYGRTATAMRAESSRLEEIMGALSERIENNSRLLAEQITLLEARGQESNRHISEINESMRENITTLARHSLLLGAAATSAREEMKTLLTDLPDAESQMNQLTELLRSAGMIVDSQAVALQSQLLTLTQKARDADLAAGGAAERLANELNRIEAASASAAERLGHATEDMNRAVDSVIDKAGRSIEDSRRGLDIQGSAMIAMIEQGRAALDRAGIESTQHIAQRIEQVGQQVDAISARLAEQHEASSQLFAGLETGFEAAEQRFTALKDSSTERTADLAEAIVSLTEHAEHLTGKIGTSSTAATELLERAEALRTAIDACTRDVNASLPLALAQLEEQLTHSEGAIARALPDAQRLEQAARSVAESIGEAGVALSRQDELLGQLGESATRQLGMVRDEAEQLQQLVSTTEESVAQLSGGSTAQLVDALHRVRQAATEAADRARATLGSIIPEAAEALAAASAEAIEKSVAEPVQQQLAQLSQSAQEAVAAAQVAGERLMRQMLTIAETTRTVEARIAEAKADAERNDQDKFSRHVSLLIESLNSTAIDVTKILSNEVTDAAWAAYLRGDRGVFTRRAVKLLDAGEAREIARHYEDDPEFREQVNRYIHDFEAMLRRVLATRDGTPLGVTLLSSDMGKLYVALAQAIERLRT